jgi:hypothetical protein
LAKDRVKQKANGKMAYELEASSQREEMLSTKNEWNNKDLTPYNMVRQMNGMTILYK